MAQNPLLGKRISLISKKNIRYEGLLYSINEQNATVALQNVRSFGTETREVDDEGNALVAPSDAVHPYLLFRGQDIKDLHVHESPAEPAVAAAPPAPAAAPAATEPAPSQQPDPPTATAPQETNDATANGDVTTNERKDKSQQAPQSPKAKPTPKSKESEENRPPNKQGGRGGPRRQRSNNAAVGTGASLLNRKARGVIKSGDAAPEEPANPDFDFQTSLEHFQKEENDDNEAGDGPAGSGSDSGIAANVGTYEKDDFFDSISCDALDKQHGIDNRLRGSAERRINTETFGAVALNTNNRRKRGGRGGRGGGRDGGGRGGRGRGRGRGGRGRGRGGRGRSNHQRDSHRQSTGAVAAS